MDMQENNNTDTIINYLISLGFSYKDLKSFIENNIDFLNNDNFDINKLFLIKNNNDIYAILYINENDYYWSINKHGIYTTFKSNHDMDKDEIYYTDYIVESVLRFTTSEKISTIIPDIIDKPLEERVNKVKKLGLNKKGYHIQ